MTHSKPLKSSSILSILLLCMASQSFGFLLNSNSLSKTLTTTTKSKTTSAIGRSRTPSSSLSLLLLNAAINREMSPRWNGNYKHVSNKLGDIPKKKKMNIELTANGVTKTLEKKRMETLQHVLTKAVLWKLFMEEYPNIQIEYDIGDPDYLPDVISFVAKEQGDTNDDNDGGNDDGDDDSTLTNGRIRSPLFWGESGRMKVHKAVDLLQRYPDTHIVHCRWGIDIEAFATPLEEYLEEQFELGTLDLSHRTAKFSFCSLPLDVWRFIDDETRTIDVTKEDLEWKDLDLAQLSQSATSV